MSSAPLSSSATPVHRSLVVDSSGVARLVAARALGPSVQALTCGSGQEALALLTPDISLVVTALRLPDMDGNTLAERIREQPAHKETPILAVSGNVTEALRERSLVPSLTDYFDKAMGPAAMAAFFQAYLGKMDVLSGKILLVEDSRTIALTTRRSLEKRGLTVVVSATAEDAQAFLDRDLANPQQAEFDLVITDVNLADAMTGLDLIAHLRASPQPWGKQIPVLVTTGDERPAHQIELLEAGADDLLVKPVREAQMMAKVGFHLWRSQEARQNQA